METSNTAKDGFTIFHVWLALAVFIGLGCGVGFGALRFGRAGGLFGGAIGPILGMIVGRLPWLVAFAFFSRTDRKTSVHRKD